MTKERETFIAKPLLIHCTSYSRSTGIWNDLGILSQLSERVDAPVLDRLGAIAQCRSVVVVTGGPTPRSPHLLHRQHEAQARGERPNWPESAEIRGYGQLADPAVRSVAGGMTTPRPASRARTLPRAHDSLLSGYPRRLPRPINYLCLGQQASSCQGDVTGHAGRACQAATSVAWGDAVQLLRDCS
jgi:hypothetical protein